MRRHDDKITALVFCGGDDAFGRLPILYVDAIASYPVSLPALDSVVKNALRCSRREGLELTDRIGPPIFSRLFRHFERRPWLCYRYNRDLRIFALGEAKPVFEGFCC